ncbi:MAG TPA: putative DNA-binding domain-containing protein [Polyangiaceae bacterium]
MQAALESVLGELLLGDEPTRTALEQLCQERGIAAPDTAALLESFERLLVYRELTRGNLREAIELSIPRSMARLGPLFDEYFARFLSERAPRTHYLRDVTTELLDFCEPLWAADPRIPGYLPELARHESLHIEVSALPSLPRGHVPAALQLEQGVELGAALRLARYRHAVHELPDTALDRSEPSRRELALLVYRSPEHEVRYLELSALAGHIVERLVAGDSLGDAVRGAAQQLGSELTEAVLASAAALLADLAERGVVWGPKA